MPARNPVGRSTYTRESRTTLARWMKAHGLRNADLHARCTEMAERIGLPPDLVPPVKSLADIALGRYQPNLAVLFLLRHVTNGMVDLEHWVRDLYTGSSELDPVAAATRDRVHGSECTRADAVVSA